jgi:copper transport protein
LVTGTPDETAALREHHGHAPRSSERQLHLMSDRFMAMVALAPGAAGANAATLTLETHDGQPFAALEVTLRLSNPDRGIAPLERPAERDADGRWTVPGLVLGTGGTWTIELDVLVSDFERQTLTATLDLDPAEHGTEGASP